MTDDADPSFKETSGGWRGGETALPPKAPYKRSNRLSRRVVGEVGLPLAPEAAKSGPPNGFGLYGVRLANQAGSD